MKPPSIKYHALTMFANGFTAVDIGLQLQVHPQTIRRWLKQPLFAKKLDTYTKDGLDEARRSILQVARVTVEAGLHAARESQHIVLSSAAPDPKRDMCLDRAFRRCMAAARLLADEKGRLALPLAPYGVWHNRPQVPGMSEEARVPQAAAQVPAPVKVDGIGPMSREDYDRMGGEAGAAKLYHEIFPGQEVEQERHRKWKESLNAEEQAEDKKDTA